MVSPAAYLRLSTWTLCEQVSHILRSDNDMYDHMNNSVYNFLYVMLHPFAIAAFREMKT